ncbi:hypothetical protein [Porphyrobacter sp. ULC335]|uniref:hypothetical protein n=1 Tax=Porphyrobacter sp. ULC335 TaxID=2854260 RepID=UPI00221F1B98|nr:hypothetical protein [Porphyrobacter sp. ULC335]UYV16677.1 hypothetical protein KVF90_04970 [Porphyrobacter sp. ULC335]
MADELFPRPEQGADELKTVLGRPNAARRSKRLTNPGAPTAFTETRPEVPSP